MTEAMKKVSSRIQEVSEDEEEDEAVVVASFFWSIEAGKRDVSSSAAD